MRAGRISSFDHGTGTGFITPTVPARTVLFLRGAVVGNGPILVGLAVQYELFNNNAQEPEARRVILMAPFLHATATVEKAVPEAAKPAAKRAIKKRAKKVAAKKRQTKKRAVHQSRTTKRRRT